MEKNMQQKEKIYIRNRYKIETIFLCFIPIVKIGFTHNFLIKKEQLNFPAVLFPYCLF